MQEKSEKVINVPMVAFHVQLTSFFFSLKGVAQPAFPITNQKKYVSYPNTPSTLRSLHPLPCYPLAPPTTDEIVIIIVSIFIAMVNTAFPNIAVNIVFISNTNSTFLNEIIVL